jgi:hypothetical protein
MKGDNSSMLQLFGFLVVKRKIAINDFFLDQSTWQPALQAKRQKLAGAALKN